MFSVILAIILGSAAQAAAGACAKTASYLEFYQCTLEKHPRMAIAQEKVREADAVYEKAAQWKNPDLALKSVGGTQGGESVGTTELTVLVPVSQLWTRGAQKSVASAEKRVVEVDAMQTLLDFKKELIRDLYRIRQIEDDLELVNETLEAFSTIQRQLGARKARGPDQEITLNLVQLAGSDYQLRKNHIQVERAEILAKLRAIWGKDFEIKRTQLPPLKDKWPEVKVASGVGQNLAVQKAVAETDRAMAEHSLTRLESLPTLSIGPVMERSTTGPSRSWAYGFALEASLPIFSWNGGARAVAESKTVQAELESAYVIKKFDTEKDILLMKYRTAVDSLTKSSSRSEVKNKHHRVDSFFRQGLASGSLVIEAHRQIVEYQQSQHKHENSAIDSYIDLMTLTGGDIEGILK